MSVFNDFYIFYGNSSFYLNKNMRLQDIPELLELCLFEKENILH